MYILETEKIIISNIFEDTIKATCNKIPAAKCKTGNWQKVANCANVLNNTTAPLLGYICTSSTSDYNYISVFCYINGCFNLLKWSIWQPGEYQMCKEAFSYCQGKPKVFAGL